MGTFFKGNIRYNQSRYVIRKDCQGLFQHTMIEFLCSKLLDNIILLEGKG